MSSLNKFSPLSRRIQIKLTTWLQLYATAPDLASYGRRRLEGRIAYLATIQRGGFPRVHPVSPFFADDRLFVYMEPTSPKAHDLHRDARYSMHCTVEDNSGGQGEFLIKGHAVEINDSMERSAAFEQARMIGYSPNDRHILFELTIQEIVATLYEQGEPKRTRWKVPQTVAANSTVGDQESNDS